MKNGLTVFLAAFVALGASWFGFVYGALEQLGGQKQTVVLQSTDNWPPQRTGEATRGLQVYKKYGCAACHTEQVRQMASANEVSLLSLGDHQAQEFKDFIQSLMILPELMPASNTIVANLAGWKGEVPFKLYSGDDSTVVSTLASKLNTVKVKAEARVVAIGPDIQRGWGMRQSVAADYLYDQPVQLGNLRAGPDLSLIGVRAPDSVWHLQHLYAPQSIVKNSTMPAFRTLFEVRKKVGGQTSPDVLVLPREFAPTQELEVVPTAEACELAAYLVSLKANQPLYEAPFTTVTAAK
jgi:cbb3-type cytochrome oxidase cytochrome c subunit